MNKHILLVMKWQNDKDSVTQQELIDNRKSAAAYAAAFAFSCATAYAAAYAADAADAEKWISKYFERSGESKQDYIDALKPKANKPIYTPKPDERCFYNFMDSTGWISCIFMGECNGTTWVISNGKHEHHKLVDMEFKPLTPPIELIDKGLYYFDVNNKKQMVGEAYYTEITSDWMITNIRANTSYHQDFCTNIKLLTVKGEE